MAALESEKSTSGFGFSDDTRSAMSKSGLIFTSYSSWVSCLAM